MKDDYRITVLGNFSGRNAGDNAILGNLLRDISTSYDNVEFIIPTLNASYVRTTFNQYKIRAYGLMPWNGSLKIFGIPIFRAMLATDLILVTDNILFDRAFFNPLFNYLSTISLIAPFCRKRNIPIVLYNASLGPINSNRGAKALQRVLDAGPVAIVRDVQSRELIQKLRLRSPKIILGADCALNTCPPPAHEIDKMMRRLGLTDTKREIVGVNVNSYFNSWQSGSSRIDRDEFTSIISTVVNELVEDRDASLVLLVTQVMDNQITKELLAKLANRESVSIVANPEYDYTDFAGILSRLALLIGMRTHAQILSVSVGTPIVNINTYPKSQAFLKTIDMDKWSLDVDDLTEDRLRKLVRNAWTVKDATRVKLNTEIKREREKALAAVTVLGDIMMRGMTHNSHPPIRPS